MNINDILVEGVSDVVFHHTGLKNAADIVKADRFKLTPTFKTKADSEASTKRRKLFFLSTARSRTGDYHQRASVGVLFQLDGKKLSQRYAGAPVDYWGSSWNKDEMEDRVYSDTNEIPAKAYITQIEIHGLNVDNIDRTHAWGVEVYIWAKRNNIPVVVYPTSESFRAGQKSKALSHADMLAIAKESKRLAHEYGPLYTGRKRSGYRLPMLLGIANKLELSKLTSDEKDVAHDLASGGRDIVSSIESDIHNYPQSESVLALSKLMRKFKTRQLGEFLKKIGNIYHAQFEEERRQDYIRRAKSEYDKEPEFHEHVNNVVAKQEKFDPDRFSHIAHAKYKAEEAIRALYLLGKLKNPNAIDSHGWADRMFVDIYFSN